MRPEMFHDEKGRYHNIKVDFSDLKKTLNEIEEVHKKKYPKGRDPKRITDVLHLLKEYWFRHPDLRLGQIIGNFTPSGQDSYYLEDAILVQKLREEIDKEENAKRKTN